MVMAFMVAGCIRRFRYRNQVLYRPNDTTLRFGGQPECRLLERNHRTSGWRVNHRTDESVHVEVYDP